jgi:hypothetical protein
VPYRAQPDGPRDANVQCNPSSPSDLAPGRVQGTDCVDRGPDRIFWTSKPRHEDMTPAPRFSLTVQPRNRRLEELGVSSEPIADLIAADENGRRFLGVTRIRRLRPPGRCRRPSLHRREA